MKPTDLKAWRRAQPPGEGERWCSQGTAARRWGVHRTTWARWETGELAIPGWLERLVLMDRSDAVLEEVKAIARELEAKT